MDIEYNRMQEAVQSTLASVLGHEDFRIQSIIPVGGEPLGPRSSAFLWCEVGFQVSGDSGLIDTVSIGLKIQF